MTSSLYVPGVMEQSNRVLVEVGAGYFIEESVEKAREYCDRKIKYLNESGQKVAEIVNVKKQQYQKVNIEYQRRVDDMQKQMAA